MRRCSADRPGRPESRYSEAGWEGEGVRGRWVSQAGKFEAGDLRPQLYCSRHKVGVNARGRGGDGEHGYHGFLAQVITLAPAGFGVREKACHVELGVVRSHRKTARL